MIWALLALLLAVPGSAQTPTATESTISLSDFSKCGYVSRFSPNKIAPECFQGLGNAVLDQDYSILRRNGYALYNATGCGLLQSVRGAWSFFATDGSQYIVVQSSASMYYSKGDGTCNPITGLNGGLSTTAQMSCVQGLGQLVCTDGVDPVFETNVVSTAVVAQAPIGKYIGFFRNRIMIAGVSANLTSVYLSGELSITDWTLPTVTYSTSPAIIKINGVNDGLGVSCLMGEYQNGYYIGRNYDTYLLSGYSLQDFALSRVDSQIGCMDNNSPQTVNNTLMWLSHRGVESLTGTQINWVSYPIDPDIKTIITAAGNSQALTVNGSNFTTGNLTASGAGAPISSTIFPGFLTVSSATFVDNTTTTFIASSLVNVSTYGANILALSISSGVVTGGNFTTGSGWTANNGSNGCASASVSNGATFTCNTKSIAVNCPNSEATCAIVVSIQTPCPGFGTGLDNGVCLRDGSTGGIIGEFDAGGNLNYTIPLNTVTSTSVFMMVNFDGTGTSRSCQNPINTFWTYVSANATTPTGFNAILDTNHYCSTYPVMTFSNIRVSSYTPTGTYTSRTFDTSFSTPTAGTTTVAISSNSISTLTLQQENSTDGSSWSSPTTLTNGNAVLAGKRYWRYLENYVTSNGTTTATSNGISSLVAETSGYYITPCVNTTGNTSYGILTVDAVNNGGSFSVWTTTGPTCSSVLGTTATWTAQTPNTIITNATAPFVSARVLFNIDVASDTPVLNDMAFNWNTGASRPPVASAEYLNRYYLFYTTAQVSGAANDHAFVFDQNGHWQLYDDIHAASAALYLNQLFLGDSQATGSIYLYDSGPSDAGGSFTFSFKTPDLDDGDPMSLKQFSRAYLVLQAPGANANSTLNCGYQIDGSTVTNSLGTVTLSEAPEVNGYFIAKLPFSTVQPVTAHWLNLSCSNTGNAGPLRVYGIKMVYTKTDWP